MGLDFINPALEFPLPHHASSPCKFFLVSHVHYALQCDLKLRSNSGSSWLCNTFHKYVSFNFFYFLQDDRKEGMTAFVEKRAPNFTNN
jgi:hypothetical protein